MKKLPKNLLTIYGRNPVLEALENRNLKIYALHLSRSNKPSPKLDKMISLAQKRGVEVKYHSKDELSFISKNKKQDQGVALDIILDNLVDLDFLLQKDSFKALGVDGVTNPQNLGMIIRSATAGDIDAIIIPKSKNAPLISPLTIKASAGTLFKMPIIYIDSLYKVLKILKENNSNIIVLDLDAKEDFKEFKRGKKDIFILGNESSGVSKEIKELANKSIKIKMNRGVESLNVAVTAALISLC
ncbi:MAG: RNA methyltransferase [Epsilonproteobacteria bacterium]|nr:RNA methyltransferase [Campylobacterota bacterium]